MKKLKRLTAFAIATALTVSASNFCAFAQAGSRMNILALNKETVNELKINSAKKVGSFTAHSGVYISKTYASIGGATNSKGAIFKNNFFYNKGKAENAISFTVDHAAVVEAVSYGEGKGNGKGLSVFTIKNNVETLVGELTACDGKTYIEGRLEIDEPGTYYIAKNPGATTQQCFRLEVTEKDTMLAPFKLSGSVTNGKKPISGATVQALSTGERVKTDEKGNFTLSSLKYETKLKITADGYAESYLTKSYKESEKGIYCRLEKPQSSKLLTFDLYESRVVDKGGLNLSFVTDDDKLVKAVKFSSPVTYKNAQTGTTARLDNYLSVSKAGMNTNRYIKLDIPKLQEVDLYIYCNSSENNRRFNIYENKAVTVDEQVISKSPGIYKLSFENASEQTKNYRIYLGDCAYNIYCVEACARELYSFDSDLTSTDNFYHYTKTIDHSDVFTTDDGISFYKINLGYNDKNYKTFGAYIKNKGKLCSFPVVAGNTYSVTIKKSNADSLSSAELVLYSDANLTKPVSKEYVVSSANQCTIKYSPAKNSTAYLGVSDYSNSCYIKEISVSAKSNN